MKIFIAFPFKFSAAHRFFVNQFCRLQNLLLERLGLSNFQHIEFALVYFLHCVIQCISSFLIPDPGNSNIASVRMCSQILLKPLAPNLYSRAFSTMKSKTSSSTFNSIPSSSNNRVYCFIRLFFGSVKIERSVDASKGSR